MPEIPDIEAYIEALSPRITGAELIGICVANPFFVRTFDPPLQVAQGKRVCRLSRVGKQIVVELEDRLFLVVHLMIAGRLHWYPAGRAIPKPSGLAALDFTSGTLIVTEAGSKRRASLRLVRGAQAVAELDRGGLEVSTGSAQEFADALRRENRTLKRALTDPGVLAGIGNAYSDEIVHRARLSPLKHTRSLDEGEVRRLREATIAVLGEWTERLRREAREAFPQGVTAFRPDMAVHGRYGLPCPVCGTPIQRIRYAENECNYCPKCQTEGRVLADRALSRLLKEDRPKTVHDLEGRRPGGAGAAAGSPGASGALGPHVARRRKSAGRTAKDGP